MSESVEARPRITLRVVLTVLGPAIAYALSSVDPLMLTLNLSAVGSGLDVPAQSMGLLAGASTLMVAASVLAVGNLGDRHGLKRVLMYALVANIAVGVLSAFSPNHPTLLVMRFLDGLALAALVGLSLALVTVSVDERLRPAAIGILMAIDTVMYGVTPALGGWVVETFGWRALFLVTPPFALVALVLIARYVTDPPRRPARNFDILGVLLFGVALLGLVAGIGAVPAGVQNPAAWVPLSVCLLSVVAFLRHERRVPEPALDLTLFRDRAFVVAVLAVVTVNLLAAGLGTVLGQLGGTVLRLGAEEIGLLYLPGTLVIAGASILAGRMVAKYSARPVMVTGLLFLVAGGLVMAFTASPVMGIAVLVLATWLSNLGGFVTGTATSDTVLAQATPATAGSVAAVQPAFSMAGYALGPTLYILLLNAMFQREWLADAESRGLSAQDAEQAVHAVTMSMANSTGGTSGYDPNVIQLAHGLTLGFDYTDGIRLTMLIVTALPLTVAVLAHFLMPRKPEEVDNGA
ncbi:MAG: MFS transporter [Rhodococcus sp. (in: high G+C Gram-positive bacteria)]|uniref:MFS transporter n=1 Tax=Rhodococcus sp. TaxID=1831 RepID=UPI003BAE5C11